MLTQEQFDEWITALRAGPYTKGCGSLFWRNPDTYCCLGVLSHLHRKSSMWMEGCLGLTGCTSDGTPDETLDGGILLRLPARLRQDLATLNDQSDTFGPVVVFLLAHENEIVGDAS